MVDFIVEFFLNFADGMGYFGVFLLMFVESSFVPFPSELVILPAAFSAAHGEMNIFIVVLLGVLGSLMGALLNYSLALYLGKPLVYSLVRSKFARFLLLDEKKLLKAEHYFEKNGVVSTFVGRLIPVIRQLISLPAGFVRMNLFKFSLYTSLGAFVWVSILAVIGYFFGVNVEFLYSIWFKIIVFVLAAIAFFLFARGVSDISKEDVEESNDRE